MAAAMIDAPPMVTPTARGTFAEEFDFGGGGGTAVDDGLPDAAVDVATGEPDFPLEMLVGAAAEAVAFPEAVTSTVVVVLREEAVVEVEAVAWTDLDGEMPIVVNETGSAMSDDIHSG